MNINLIANMNGVLIGLRYTAETEITIGREVGNTIAPLAADGLSRKHAKIYLKDGKWFVEDLGSTNGSYRQGQKLSGPAELSPRDMLQFGKFEVSVDEIGGGAAAPAPAAPAAP
ncbi:MAG: FHA domain-containing protein, partial [Kiritimatiellae bacterium]|nr:FHA domain-containing protein [Kiritimatiellia bacterium]